tara:strand:- start:269 stop:499 length:231 start_codon:yes stop_codon:yes gene_type:complete
LNQLSQQQASGFHEAQTHQKRAAVPPLEKRTIFGIFRSINREYGLLTYGDSQHGNSLHKKRCGRLKVRDCKSSGLQ